MKKSPEKRLYLGIDTSAYTTSMALVSEDEALIIDRRLPLSVKEGELGLRQSEAVFQHLSQMTQLWDRKVLDQQPYKLNGVAFSSRPRPVAGSYMPVFKVSEAFGLFLAQTMGFDFYSSSHQEGHVVAGLWSAGLSGGRYLVIHLSGGTTEILDVEEYNPGKIRIKLLGGSEDLNAGQFIDRVGKDFGLSFPAGPQLEKLALEGKEGEITLPVSVKGAKISFSGPASQAKRILSRECSHANLGRAVEICIADSISAAVNNLTKEISDFDNILVVGGVAANKFIQKRLQNNLECWPIYYAETRYASDSAVGLAVQAARLFRGS